MNNLNVFSPFRAQPLSRALLGYFASVVCVALVTLFIGLVTTRPLLPNISMLYLIAILTIAILFGTGPALATSVLAFFAYDWFFAEPPYTFTISDPSEWLALLLFLLTAFLTGRLTAIQRRGTREALQREHEAVALYEISRALGTLSNLDEALVTVVERLCSELDLSDLGILLPAADGGLEIRAASDEAMAATPEEMETAAWVFAYGKDAEPESAHPRIRLIRMLADVQLVGQTRRVALMPLNGTMRTEGILRIVRDSKSSFFPPEENRLLMATANHLGLAIERHRLRQAANQVEIFRRTDELRTALLNSVSHDLQTPLAAIKVAADSLLQEDIEWDRATVQDFTMTIDREADRLSHMITNLLDLSRIEAGALHLQKRPYPIVEVVHAVLARLNWLTADHEVVVDLPDDLPLAALDYEQIDRVLSNLIENAIKYSPHGTVIRISARAKDGELHVGVSDYGPGIPVAERTHIFERFHRLDGQHRPGGTGLGLAICKGVIEAHGGRIWVKDTPGGGATFVFTLPLDGDGTPSLTFLPDSAERPMEPEAKRL